MGIDSRAGICSLNTGSTLGVDSWAGICSLYTGSTLGIVSRAGICSLNTGSTLGIDSREGICSLYTGSTLGIWCNTQFRIKPKGYFPKLKIVWSGFPLFTCINESYSTIFLFLWYLKHLQLHYWCENTYERKLKIKVIWLWVRGRQVSQNAYFCVQNVKSSFAVVRLVNEKANVPWNYT